MSSQMPVMESVGRRLDALEKKVDVLFQTLERHGIQQSPSPGPNNASAGLTLPALIPEEATFVSQLMAEGIVRSPTAEELDQAAAWNGLPEEEKDRTRKELQGLHLQPLLSEIINRNRAREWTD
jgi:hypothetical protein